MEEAEGNEFGEWEVLPHNSDSDSVPLLSDVAKLEENCGFVQGVIQNDYFCLESEKKCMVSDDGEVSLKGLENPSWIDPTQYPLKVDAESWSDSGSDHSDGRRFGEFEGKSEVGFLQNDQNGSFQEGGIEKCGGGSSGEVVVEGVEGRGDLGVEEEEVLGGEDRGGEVCGEKGEIEVRGGEGERKKSGVVWWKLPIELLRYCVFKGPVWTVSVAAAFMGFVILGRRLYKMKKKRSMALRSKIAMDDKKISQFMSRAARLNEAFSVVKRVPVIRPSLPAAGVTPWSVVSLR